VIVSNALNVAMIPTSLEQSINIHSPSDAEGVRNASFDLTLKRWKIVDGIIKLW